MHDKLVTAFKSQDKGHEYISCNELNRNPRLFILWENIMHQRCTWNPIAGIKRKPKDNTTYSMHKSRLQFTLLTQFGLHFMPMPSPRFGCILAFRRKLPQTSLLQVIFGGSFVSILVVKRILIWIPHKNLL